MPSFQILIATLGRPQLQQMLDSVLSQLSEEDQLTIVFDGKTDIPIFNLSSAKCSIRQYCEPTPLGYFGHGIRTKYANILEKRDFVMHLDDDDYLVPGSIQKLKQLCCDPNILYISRMTCNHGTVIVPRPGTTTVQTGNIGTPCGIIPFELNKKAEWLRRFGGDGAFYEKIASMTRFKILDIIHYIIRPQVNGFNVPAI
jgi:hypothetical protein